MTEYELMLKRVVEDEVKPYIKALVDDTVKGILRSIGDAGATPANTTGETILRRLADVETHSWAVREASKPRSAYGTSTAAALTVTLAVELEWEGRSYVGVGVRSSSSGDFYVEGSHNSARWWLVDTLTVTADVDRYAGYLNAFPYIRVRTDLVADNEIVIVASR